MGVPFFVMTEEQLIQVEVMQHIADRYPDVLAFHVANERKSSKQQGAMLKRMGVLKGVSDIIIMEPRGGYHGAVIELKAKKGRPSSEQVKFISRAKERGYFGGFTVGARQSIRLVDWYLNL